MKLHSIIIFFKSQFIEKPIIISSAYYLDDFMFWQRSSAKDIIKFISREVVGRVLSGKNSILHQGYICHTYIRFDNLACSIICDEEYPENIAFKIIFNVLSEFMLQNFDWSNQQDDIELNFPYIYNKIEEWQDPTKVDKIQQIQSDIEDTKITIIKTIDQLLDRGERLETLASRSDDLSLNSKIFLDKSKDMNNCCIII